MQQPSFQPMPASLKYLVIAIVVIEIAATAQEFGLIRIDQLRGKLVIYGGLWPQVAAGAFTPIYFGQSVFMYVTHAFVHGSVLHMAMNTAIILALGKRLSQVIGSRWVLILFFVSAAAGGIFFVLFNGSGAPAVGASGAAFGFFGFWKFLEYRMLRRNGAALTPIFQFIGILVLMNIVLWYAFDGLLAWEAHLGGFIAGWLLGAVFRPNSRQAPGA